MINAEGVALLQDACTCLTHWDQGVVYSPLARASRRTADYPSRIALLIADLAREVLPWSEANCAPLFRDLDDGLAEWWVRHHGMIFPFDRLMHRARVIAVRRGLAPAPVREALRATDPRDIRFVPMRVGDTQVVLLPAGAAREELWMLGDEEAFIAHARHVLAAMPAAHHLILCESALAAWLLQEVAQSRRPVLPLALWLAKNKPAVDLQCPVLSPVVIQDSSCLSRVYLQPEAAAHILTLLPASHCEPVRSGAWAVAAAAEYEHHGLDPEIKREIARRRYQELTSTGARTIITLEPYAAAALRAVASERVAVVSLRELVCAERSHG